MPIICVGVDRCFPGLLIAETTVFPGAKPIPVTKLRRESAEVETALGKNPGTGFRFAPAACPRGGGRRTRNGTGWRDRLYRFASPRTMSPGSRRHAPAPPAFPSLSNSRALDVAYPLFLTRLLARSGIARFLPFVQRWTDGGGAYLQYYSDRIFTAPVAELRDASMFLETHGPDAIDLALGSCRNRWFPACLRGAGPSPPAPPQAGRGFARGD